MITQGEMYPVVLAKRVWRALSSGRKVLWFIDYEGARFCFLKCASQSWSARQLLWLTALEDFRSGAYTWFARVISESNLADSVSRNDFSIVQSMHATRVYPAPIEISELQCKDHIVQMNSA